MRFNADKCYILSINSKSSHYYQLNGTILKEVEDNPYLGLTISNDLRWTKQIGKTTAKASSALGFIRRNLQQCPQETRLQAYISLVRSQLEYGAVIWDSSVQQEIDQLERIQRQGARFITRDYRSKEKGCMTRMLKNLNLPTLQERRKELRLTLLFKVAKDLLPAIPPENYLKPKRETRNIQPTTHTKYKDYKTKNLVDKYETKHSKCYQIPQTRNPSGPYQRWV